MYPNIFHIGPITISTIWIFIILSFYIFIKLLVKSMQKKRADFQFLYSNSTFLIISFIIGARIAYILQNISYYFYDTSLKSMMQIFAIWDKGLSFFGGLIFILFAILYKTHKEKESFTKWIDYLIEPFLYVLPIAYIGKFFDGSGSGSKTDLPIGVTFENMNIAIITPIHPTQLYSALLFIICIFGYKYYIKHNKETIKIQGVKSALITILISIVFLIENQFRGDITLMIFNIRIATYLSLFSTIIASIYFKKLTR